MSTPPLTNAPNIALETGAAVARTPSPKPVVSPGVGSGDSSLAPAPSFSNKAAAVASSIGSWVMDKIYGPGQIPTQTIPLEQKSWFGGTYIEQVRLDYALQNHLITPQQAKKKGYCNDGYLKARGYAIVKFTYSSWLGQGNEYHGKLKTALKKGYITIEKAIERNFITKEQAIEGGFLKS